MRFSSAAQGRPDPKGAQDFQSDWGAVFSICILIATLVWLVFGQTLGHGFINFDDDVYVYQNPTVLSGVSKSGIVWAFTFAAIGHWHPVTWWSHMLDCQVLGLWAGGHHLTNVMLHAAAALLLFLALLQMTDDRRRATDRSGDIWRSAFVAALFAIHPLRVESVAWISERKDVLSGVFFMLTLLAYVAYARKPPSVARYLPVPAFFALGLMSKGALVTVPFVLLLLDYWPLGRLSPKTIASIGQTEHRVRIRRLITEKIPLFLLSAGSCIATGLSPEKIPSALQESLGSRLENAVVSYAIYLKQLFYPAGLGLPYFNPPEGLPVWEAILAAVLLIAISIGAIACRKAHPYWLVGWFWYLGMMVPVIGIVQISYYARADRYTYLPHIGLYVIAAWGAAKLLARMRLQRELAVVAALVVIAAFVVQARSQTSYWRDSERLWTHVLATAPNNYVAHTNLGLVFDQTGRSNAAIAHYQKALEIQPAYSDAHNNLGNALARINRFDDAIDHYRKALDLVPGLPQVHNNLGSALAQNGQMTEAILEFQKALEINPDMAGAHSNLGYALLQTGRHDEAVAHFQKAIEIRPDSVEAHKQIAGVYLQKGQVRDAIDHFRKALALKPDQADAYNGLATSLARKREWSEAIANYQEAIRLDPRASLPRTNLAWLLATASDENFRNGAQAVVLARESCQLTDEPDASQLDTLAAALAELRDFPAASETASSALGRARAKGDDELAREIERRLESYRQHQPYRQSPNENASAPN